MKKILIVDDYVNSLNYLEALLKGNGYEVMKATNGADALDLARQSPPNLIVSDILMPVMDGFQLCREWRKDDRLKTVPFIFYTAAYTEQKEEEFGLSLGADRFVIKPERSETLLRIFEEVIQEKRARGMALKKPLSDDMEFFRQYNRVLFGKLEKKMSLLEAANEDLKQSEEKYRDIFQNAIEGIYRMSPEGRFIQVNPAFARMFGFNTPEELMAEPVDIRKRLYANPDDRKRLKEAFAVNGVVQGFETEVCRKNGSTFWIFINAREVRDSSGTVLYYEGTNIDITTRKQVEADIIQEKNLYADLVNAQPSGVYRLRVDHREPWKIDTWKSLIEQRVSVEICSDKHCEILGVSRDDFMANPVILLDIIHPDDMESFTVRNLQAGENRKPFQWEGRIIRSGEVRWVYFESLPRELSPGIVLWTGIVYDITDRKRVEEELQDSESKMRAIFESVEEGILILDLDGTIQEVNKAFCQMHGYTYDELTGMNLRSLVAEESRHAIEECLRDHTIGSRSAVEGKNVRKDGRIFFVEVSSRLLLWKNKPYLLVVIVDITQRKDVEETLRNEMEISRQYLETAGVMMIVLNTRAEIVLINRKGCEILGCRKDDALGKNWIETFIPERERNMVRDTFNGIVSGYLAVNEYAENRIVTCDGEERLLAWHNAILKSNDGTITGTLSSGEDITERKWTEERLKQKMNDLERFHRLTVDRELRLRDLKKEINALLNEVGREEKYRIIE